MTATVDAARLESVGPPTERVEVTTVHGNARTTHRYVGGRAPGQAGARVVTPRGSSVVRPDDAFLVPAETGDEVSLEGETGSVDLGAVEASGPIDATVAPKRRPRRSRDRSQGR